MFGGLNMTLLVDLSGQLSNLQQATMGSSGPAGSDQPSLPRRKLQAQPRLATHEVEQLLDAYRAGSSATELSAVFGIHRTTALDHLARNGVDRRVNSRRLDDEEVAKAADMYRRGLSLAVVGRLLAVNATTVARELRAAGVELRPRRGRLAP